MEGLKAVARVRPRVREDLTVVELDGEAVIYDEDTAELHRLNPTATVVLALCDGTSTMREMSADISEVFGAPVDQVEHQVRAIVRDFQKAQLLVPAGSPVRSETMA